MRKIISSPSPHIAIIKNRLTGCPIPTQSVGANTLGFDGPLKQANADTERELKEHNNYKHCVTSNCNPESFPEFSLHARDYVNHVLTMAKLNDNAFPTELKFPPHLLANVMFTLSPESISGYERIFYCFHQVLEACLEPAYASSEALKTEHDQSTINTLLQTLSSTIFRAANFLSLFNKFMKPEEFNAIRPYLNGASGAQSPFRCFSVGLYGPGYKLDDGLLNIIEDFSDENMNVFLSQPAFELVDASTKDVFLFIISNNQANDSEAVSNANTFKASFETIVSELFPNFFKGFQAGGLLARTDREKVTTAELQKQERQGVMAPETGSFIPPSSLLPVAVSLFLFRLQHLSIVSHQIKKAFEENAPGTGGSPLRDFLVLSLVNDYRTIKILEQRSIEGMGLRGTSSKL